MSGHSKWSTIKRKKGALDAKRGQMFTRLIKEITIAARAGGGDIEGNARLRTAVANAKTQNMPKDNIERAIKKGTGELDGVNYEEITYEGYAPGGVAVMVETVTDNKNRTVSEVRYVFSKHGGSMAATGAVGYMFSRKGQIEVSKDKATEEKLMEVALDAGAEDIKDEGEGFTILTAPADLENCRAALAKAGIEPDSAENAYVPSTLVAVDGKQAVSVLKFLDAMDDVDDVQHVWSNADLPEDAEAE